MRKIRGGKKAKDEKPQKNLKEISKMSENEEDDSSEQSNSENESRKQKPNKIGKNQGHKNKDKKEIQSVSNKAGLTSGSQFSKSDQKPNQKSVPQGSQANNSAYQNMPNVLKKPSSSNF